MSDFITDVERQYEMYCKIAEEHGFIDLNAKKNGFRCTTKSNEFNAGWIAFVGAVAAVRDEQQAKIEKLEIELSTTKQVLGNVIDMEVAKVDNLKAQLNNMEACYIEKKKQVEACAALAAGWSAITWDKTTHWTEGYEEGCYHCSRQIEEALRGAND